VNCREFVEFMMGYLDAELSERQRVVFEAHMGDCPGCVTYLDTYRETVRLGREICADPEGPVPDDVPEDLVRAILAAREEDGGG
jgi:anti-sigma factor RsiW